MKRSILHSCLGTARKHVLKHRYNGRKFHYSFIVQDNSIIEWATNSNYTPGLHFGYSKRIGGNEAFCHSELAVWYKSKGLVKGSFELVNIRLNKQGEIRISKPCICCYEVLSVLGCTKFHFSTPKGFVSC